jgi:hypothetical protein
MPSLRNIADVTVSTAAVIIVPANPSRTRVIISQSSANPVRVGVLGVLATSGVRLAQGSILILETNGGTPCPTEAIYAIREGAADGTCQAIEVSEP